MFKKAFASQGQNLLSKKDLKQLRAQLGEQFPSLDEKALDELLPSEQVKVLKLDNRSLLYVHGDSPPVFFDAEGRGELFPTLHTLWQHPYIMPELTIHPPVSKFVLNGADLMLPGVIVPANGVAGLGTVTKGQKRSIKIEGNPYPIAVGKMLVNQTQMEKLKGKGLEVCHVFKDALWAFSGKALPNAGFTEGGEEVFPCSDAASPTGAAAASAGAEASASSSAAAAPEAEAAESGASPKGEASSPAAGSEEEPKASAGGGSKKAEDWSQDDLLEFCFLQAFKVSLTDDKALPVEASELYEKHMKPSRPEGTTLDVKKSSHKLIGKFLNAMRKAKVIDTNEKKGVISVTKVDRGHKLFVELGAKFAADAAEAADSKAASSAAEAAAGAGKPEPRVTTMWKPTHYVEPMFKAAGKGKADLFTWEEAVEVLRSFVEQEGPMKDDVAKLNEDILTALYRAAGAQKKGLEFPEEADFSELCEKMQERMQEHTTVDVAGVGPTTRKGPLMRLEVSLSRKGAHNVTRVCNLEAYGLNVDTLASEMKKKLNCTVHIEDMPGKSTKDKMVQFQGHVAQELADYLLKEYGITKAFMSVK